MNLHRRLAALFVILALVGCAQVATGQGQAPYSHESGTDTRSGVDGGSGGM
jgi:hypothetical protein